MKLDFVHERLVRGWFNEWQGLRGESRARFEASLRGQSATSPAAKACLERITALRGGMLLDVKRVREVLCRARDQVQASGGERELAAFLSAAEAVELCEAWLAAHAMCGGAE